MNEKYTMLGRKILLYSLFFIASSLLLSSCTEELSKKFANKSNAIGTTNQIVVVMDENLWETELQDSILFYYGAPYPVLPSPEPIYDIQYYSGEDLLAKPARRNLRIYVVIADINDKNSATTQLMEDDLGEIRSSQAKVGRDKWAKGQLIVYLMGDGIEDLKEKIPSTFSGISKKIDDFNNNAIEATTYFGGDFYTLQKEVEEKLKINIRLPQTYQKAIETGNKMWIRDIQREENSNIVLYRIPYENQEQLSREGIKTIRNQVTRNLITTEIDGAYMQVNDNVLPMYVSGIDTDEYYVLQARGYWEMVNDYLGGPFISYLLHKKGSNELIFADAFVHLPGKKKRDRMQRLEHILKTVSYE